jgi:hypothetical protein
MALTEHETVEVDVKVITGVKVNIVGKGVTDGVGVSVGVYVTVGV